MPYRAGKRLPAERASKLGHLDILKSPLVKELVESFDDETPPSTDSSATWQPMPTDGEPLPIVFGVDGSVQTIKSDIPPHKVLAFVKTALLRLDEYALSRVDKDSPHPFVLRDILADSALYHATVFPLRHVSVSNLTTYDAVRQVIFESIKDASLNAEPMETLKWLVYEQWDGKNKALPPFECPHCGINAATLPYNEEEGQCPECSGTLFVTDMLGFHLDMAPDSAPDSIATTYMLIHETLLLFSGIRFFWQTNRDLLSDCLFVKDGPLSIRAQYSKLVAPIRRFLNFAHAEGCHISIIGQEKTGRFAEHLELIGRTAPAGSLFIPSNRYIKEDIQHRPDRGYPYGKDTNYGAKVLVKINEYHQMVLNIPTRAAQHVPDPAFQDLLSAERIFATLPRLLSHRYEGGLIPIELANGVASLSTYPSAQILKIFAETQAAKT